MSSLSPSLSAFVCSKPTTTTHGAW